MNDGIVLKSGNGRISQCDFNKNFVKMNLEYIKNINESHIGNEVIVIYKYFTQLFGNFHIEVLYHGILVNGCYDNFIWIKDNTHKKIGKISKKRFSVNNSVLELYTKQFRQPQSSEDDIVDNASI